MKRSSLGRIFFSRFTLGEVPTHSARMGASATSSSAASGKNFPTRRVLGVEFFVGTIEGAVERSLAGGLVVAPSGPGLAVDLVRSPAYREALTTAELAVTDSGWMVILWRLFTGEKLPRHSGLKLIRAVLAQEELKAPGAVFWVMPSAEESARNLACRRRVLRPRRRIRMWPRTTRRGRFGMQRWWP
jgi:hypothetical protein